MSQEAPGCLGVLLRLFGVRIPEPAGKDGAYTYRLRDDFLSPAEASFCQVLRLVVGQRYLVCPKVSLKDLFYASPRQGNLSAMNRIAQKHVDFLLVDPSTLKPVAGLELDDASHQSARAAERDEVKSEVFAVAGLPLIRVPTQRAYEVTQVSELLSAVLPTGIAAEDTPAPWKEQASSPSTASPPNCPKCGVTMTLRSARRGENQGREFWGCSDFPKCRGVVPVAETS